MNPLSSSIAGVIVRPVPVSGDARGEFRETFRQSWFPDGPDFVQGNASTSRRNVLRGMHYHLAQDDFWVLAAGRVTVALADIRRSRPRRVECFALSVGLGIYVPRGVAHGFYVHDDALLLYHVSREYDGSDEYGIAWNDPDLAIPWPCDAPILSDRDRSNPVLSALEPSRLPP